MALITAGEARLYIRGLSGTGEDTDLDTLISRADAVLGGWCGFPAPDNDDGVPTLESATYTHYSGLDFTATARRIQLPVRPVTAITSIHADESGEWTYAAGEEIDSGDYVLDGKTGRVDLLPDATDAFIPGLRNTKVIYTAGFATVPEDVKKACALLVKHWWGMRGTQGRTTMNMGGKSASRPPFNRVVGTTGDTLPNPVKQIMGRYRLWEAAIG